MKRIMLFIGVNIAVMVMATTLITLLTNLFGLGPALTQNGIDYTSLGVICLVWGMGGSFVSLMISKWAAKTAMGVRIVDENGPYARIVRKIHIMSQQAGIEKMPEVGVYDSPEINAFATGPSKNNSLVAVSTGLLEKMNEAEVEGVLAHEIAHVANGDMVTMTLVQGIVNAFVMFIARVVAFFIDRAMRDEEGRGGLGGFASYFLVIILQVVFGIAASPIIFWFSRHREYRADEGGARLAGKDKMIMALQALQRNYPVLQEVEAHSSNRDHQNYRAMQISSPTKSELFSTHPTLEKRIQALQNANL